jgi:hypothetical protein
MSLPLSTDCTHIDDHQRRHGTTTLGINPLLLDCSKIAPSKAVLRNELSRNRAHQGQAEGDDRFEMYAELAFEGVVAKRLAALGCGRPCNRCYDPEQAPSGFVWV